MWRFSRAALSNAALEVSQTATQSVVYGLLSACRAALPNFQVFWLSDTLTQKKAIPTEYIAWVVPYALALVTAMLALATALFQRREVG